MPSALTPEVALDYLRELSADIRAAVLLDADGRRLAGGEALVEPARALLAAAPDDSAIEVVSDRGAVFAARSPQHALCVVTGRFALPALVLYDLRTVLTDLQVEVGRKPDGLAEAPTSPTERGPGGSAEPAG